MPYRTFPAHEYQQSVIGGQANGAVVEFTFGSYDGDGEIATATSGFAGIIAKGEADNVQAALKMGGFFHLKVNGSTGGNIAAMDPLKPLAAGLGCLADTNNDKFSAIAMEAATTDAVNILVYICHGYVGA